MMGEKKTLTSQGPYIEKPYLNSNKEPFGMTIKGKSKEFIAGHGHIKELMIRGKAISTKVGKIRVLDVSHGKAIVNAILEVSIDESPDKGEVELKIHNPSLDKKKGATLELRKLSGFEYVHVEQLREILKDILNNFISESQESMSRTQKEKSSFKCNVCDWETRFEPALKGHIKRMHSKDQGNKIFCPKCGFKTDSKATLNIHDRMSHPKDKRKRSKATVCSQCSKCDLTVVDEERLNIHIKADHNEGDNETTSPSSSPPRKKLEIELEEEEEVEMLDLDDVEIVIEKELNVRLLQEKRIKELEFLVEVLLEKTEKKCGCEFGDKGVQGESGMKKHFQNVHEAHLSKLNGYTKVYKTLGNGACLENAIAFHVTNDEKNGPIIKSKINNHIADNWDNFYWEKIPLPYKETVGVGEKSKVVEIKTREEMLDFLRSEEAMVVYSNNQELLAASNIFNMKINIFTYNGDDGVWSQVAPHPELSSCVEVYGDWIPDMFLYNSLDTHYDLLVKDDEFVEQKETKEPEEWKDVKVRKNRKKKVAFQDEILLLEDNQKPENDNIEEEIILFDNKNSGHKRVNPQTCAENVKNTPQIFKCTKCNLQLESRGLLDAHLNTHKELLYSCDVCDLSYKKVLELEMHKIEQHEDTVEYEWNCNECPFQGTEPRELMNHLKLKAHQPSPAIKDKNLVFSDYRRCYTCDLEFEGYVNLMNHRKFTHPSKKKCRNFPDGRCKWGKTCWYIHAEDLMEVDETFKHEEEKHICFICSIEFANKDTLKKHKKREHTANVQKCERFLENKCERSPENCWFIHEDQSTPPIFNSLPKSETNPRREQDFHEGSKNPFPPESVQKIILAVEYLTQKIQNMDQRLSDLGK